MVRQLVFTSLLLIITPRFTYGGRKICSSIKKFQNSVNMIMEGFLSQQFYTKKGARKLSWKEIKEEIRLFSTNLTWSLWLKILKTRQIGTEIIIRSWRAATKVVVTWIFAVLKTHSTVSYFSLNFGFCLKLQTIPDIKKMSWIFSRRFHRWNPFLENL